VCQAGKFLKVSPGVLLELEVAEENASVLKDRIRHLLDYADVKQLQQACRVLKTLMNPRVQILFLDQAPMVGLFFRLDLHDIRRLRSLRSLYQLEAATISLLQCSISVSHNPGVVDERTGSVFTAYKAVCQSIQNLLKPVSF
jgi:hypothetical protein